MKPRFACVCILAWLLPALAQLTAPRLELLPPIPDTNRFWPLLSSSFHSNCVLWLEAATDLASWEEVATLHNACLLYPDVGAGAFPWRFYRLRAAARGNTDDWKNQVLYPADPFCSTNDPTSTGLRWIKFAILLDEPFRVYYQDSQRFQFHFDYASRRLRPFLGWDRAAFDAVSLWRAGQQVVLGSLLYPPTSSAAEYGVQFIGMDPYSPEEIGRWFALVRATVSATNGAAAYYVPTFEQSDAARTSAEALAALGVTVGTVERWVSVNTCYSPGWALGKLKFFSGAEVAAAFADGRLLPGDILLTDGVPADTPPLAGIVSLVPSTPNSHTALLSQSFGAPFVYLADAGEQTRVRGLVGHKVLVRATINGSAATVKVLDAEDLPAEVEAALEALKAPPLIGLTPKQPYGAISASTDTLVPSDIRYFGGKAANYGFLRRAVPTNCPAAIAFSFDLWDAFLDQTLTNGHTLRAEIGLRLLPYTNYPPPVPALKRDLAAVRDLFTKVARFTPGQQAAVLAALAQSDTRRNLRFRSSTNVEDTEQFTGAGLYDSFSGCLMDDLDGDDAGPCQCDPTESKERGVFRALQKVYASFYNDDAYLERLYHRVDESQVGMAVLVHHSFPDPDELANGVATLKFTFSTYSTNLMGDLVSQVGATSVSNPDGSALPEIVACSRYSASIYSQTLKQYSSLLPLGAHVLDWPAEYRSFVELFFAVGRAFHQYYPSKAGPFLDFEYKKDARMGWVVKQVREVPQPNPVATLTPYLIDEPGLHSIRQGEGGSVFTYHRLKSRWTLHSRNLALTAENLAGGIYGPGSLQYADNGVFETLAGPLSGWPDASNSPSGATNYWTTGSGTNHREWQLITSLRTNVPAAQPVVTLTEFAKRVTVTYAVPMLITTYDGAFTNTTCESVDLDLDSGKEQNPALQQRAWTNTQGTVCTRFHWQPSMITAPLFRFVETRITGLTTQPIVLTNEFSQSYRPLHHNWGEEFLFEPGLDPALTPAQKAELDAARVRMVYGRHAWTDGTSRLWLIGSDQKLRAWW